MEEVEEVDMEEMVDMEVRRELTFIPRAYPSDIVIPELR